MSHYDTLGVTKSASDAEIKASYRELVTKYHPDRQGGDAERFRQVQKAFSAVRTPEKRHEYDQSLLRKTPASGPTRPTGTTATAPTSQSTYTSPYSQSSAPSYQSPYGSSPFQTPGPVPRQAPPARNTPAPAPAPPSVEERAANAREEKKIDVGFYKREKEEKSWFDSGLFAGGVVGLGSLLVSGVSFLMHDSSWGVSAQNGLSAIFLLSVLTGVIYHLRTSLKRPINKFIRVIMLLLPVVVVAFANTILPIFWIDVILLLLPVLYLRWSYSTLRSPLDIVDTLKEKQKSKSSVVKAPKKKKVKSTGKAHQKRVVRSAAKAAQKPSKKL